MTEQGRCYYTGTEASNQQVQTAVQPSRLDQQVSSTAKKKAGKTPHGKYYRTAALDTAPSPATRRPISDGDATSERACGSADICLFFSPFNHYYYATYLDHGEVMYSPFPVRCPRGGGTLQAPFLPSAQACPVRREEKKRRELTKEIKSVARVLLLVRQYHEGGVGRNSDSSSPAHASAPSSSASDSLSSSRSRRSGAPTPTPRSLRPPQSALSFPHMWR